MSPPIDDVTTLSVTRMVTHVPNERQRYVQTPFYYWHGPVKDAQCDRINGYVISHDFTPWAGQQSIRRP